MLGGQHWLDNMKISSTFLKCYWTAPGSSNIFLIIGAFIQIQGFFFFSILINAQGSLKLPE